MFYFIHPGLDIPDIRNVYHYGVPVDLDEYVQETGRAGRDGERCNAIVIRHDKTLAGGLISENMKQYLSTSECRRVHLLKALGVDTSRGSGHILCCDNCSNKFNCCSCGDQYECYHIEQGCFCVKWCHTLSKLERVSVPSAASQPSFRPPLTPDETVALQSSLYDLVDERVTMPSNVNTIYPELIDNLIDSYVYIGSSHDILKLGAYSVTDAERLFSVISEFSTLSLTDSD